MPTPRPAVRPISLAVAAGAATVIGCVRTPPAAPFEPRAIQARHLDVGAAPAARQPALDPAARTESGVLDVETLVNRAARTTTNANGLGFGDRPTTRGASTRPAPATLELTLADCVRLATLNNFDVRVAAFGPAIEETRVIEAEARFDPVVQQRFEFQYSDQQITNLAGAFAGPAIVNDLQRNYTSSSSISQPLGNGGEASITYGITYLDAQGNVDRGLTDTAETFQSSLTLRFTQPLLRDFGRDVNRARIVINRNNQRVEVLNFRDAVEQATLRVEQAYWQLYAAEREVEAQRDLLERTVDASVRIERRFREGRRGDRGQVSQALASVYEREIALIQAESRRADLSSQLKLLVADPDLPVAGPTRIIPTTEPVAQPLVFDLNESIESALLYRPELAQQVVRVASSETALRVGRNSVLPRLDFVLTGGVQGLDDDFGGAVENQFGFDGFTAGAGLQLEIPLGNRAARSVLKRALLQRLQAILEYGRLANQIAFEVDVALRRVDTAYAVLRKARDLTAAAEEQVRVSDDQEEQATRLDANFIDRRLRFLGTLAIARSSEARALADFNAALAEFERSKGTLLRYNNIVLNEE